MVEFLMPLDYGVLGPRHKTIQWILSESHSHSTEPESAIVRESVSIGKRSVGRNGTGVWNLFQVIGSAEQYIQRSPPSYILTPRHGHASEIKTHRLDLRRRVKPTVEGYVYLRCAEAGSLPPVLGKVVGMVARGEPAGGAPASDLELDFRYARTRRSRKEASQILYYILRVVVDFVQFNWTGAPKVEHKPGIAGPTAEKAKHLNRFHLAASCGISVKCCIMSSSSMGNCSGALGVAKNSSNDLLPFNWRLLQREEDDIKRFRNGAETGPVISANCPLQTWSAVKGQNKARRITQLGFKVLPIKKAWNVQSSSMSDRPDAAEEPGLRSSLHYAPSQASQEYLLYKIVDESVECGDLVIQSGHFVYGLDEEGFNLLYFGFGRNMIRVQKEQLEVLHIIKYRLRVNSNTEHIKVVILVANLPNRIIIRDQDQDTKWQTYKLDPAPPRQSDMNVHSSVNEPSQSIHLRFLQRYGSGSAM
ncbi:hypothetical protein FB451DRAFT_1195666 [Mycena latifolia]|nr:hypothetical protein FB451DRAFT_1195666 [Mycena latifolia]